MPGGSAEDTIRQILPPTELPTNPTEILNTVNEDVSRLEPWNLSPIVRTALMARDRIEDLDVPFKAVVLISDCVDTVFDKDKKNIKSRAVKDALRSDFSASGVAVGVLALPVPKDEAAFQAEFAIVSTLKPAGKFVPTELEAPDRVKDLPGRVAELSYWLRNGLNPRVRYALDPVNGLKPATELVASTATADNWFPGRLDPGTYRLSLRGGPEGVNPMVKLEPGDRLLLDLVEDNGEIDLRRHWWADTVPGAKSGLPSDAWRLSLLQNRSEAGGLGIFAAIEDRPKVVEPVSVLRMGDVWFDLQPEIPKPVPVSLRWRTAPGYPAPCWSMDVPGWPAFPGGVGGASPTLKAWWNPGKPFPADGTWGAPPAGVRTMKNQSKILGGTTLTIDSVDFEEHAVDGKPEPRKCLVVRLSHAHDKTAWVRPIMRPIANGEKPIGSEVRVYREADKVTCFFWDLDVDRVTGFEVVLLDEALKKARAQGHYAEVKAFSGPTENSPRPEPPVVLR
jgi:hypothetical protein